MFFAIFGWDLERQSNFSRELGLKLLFGNFLLQLVRRSSLLQLREVFHEVFDVVVQLVLHIEPPLAMLHYELLQLKVRVNFADPVAHVPRVSFSSGFIVSLAPCAPTLTHCRRETVLYDP